MSGVKKMTLIQKSETISEPNSKILRFILSADSQVL